MAKQEPINVLLITCDCLRADVVGCCAADNGSSLTPNLDQLAGMAVTFKTAISQGFRTPVSMPSLFTGKYPNRLKWSTIQSPFGRKRQFRCLLMGEEKRIAEVLAEHNYKTAGIHSNPLLTSSFGYEKGFQYFYDDLFLKKARLPSGLKRWIYRLPHMFRASTYMPAAKLNQKALTWLRKAQEPAFCWLHYMDAHGPYQSKKGFSYLNRIRADLLFRKAVNKPKAITDNECRILFDWYKEEVGYLDDQLGKLFESLRRMGKYENTLIIVTADHGEEFREHGRLTHHSTLYEEIIHVPVIIKLPYSQHQGKIVEKPIELVQIFPTILDVLGFETDLALDGKSLLPLIDGNGEQSQSDFAISQGKFSPKYRAAIRNEEWKLILDDSLPRPELYNLKKDPRELSDVVRDNPQVAFELETLLRENLTKTFGGNGKSESPQENVDKEVLERLKELGYL